MAFVQARDLLVEFGQRIQADRKSWQDLPFSCRWTIRDIGSSGKESSKEEVWLLSTHAETPVRTWEGPASTSAYACEAALSADDFILLMRGKVSAQQLYLERRLVLAGNWSEALKLAVVVERFSVSTPPAR